MSAQSLKEMTAEINNNLASSMEGKPVASAYAACSQVHQMIEDSSFYSGLADNGLASLLVMGSDISQMDKICLKVSKTDSNPKPIMEIKMSISYFDSGNFAAGGILDHISCCLTPAGEKIGDVPVGRLIMIMQYSDAEERMASLDAEIADMEARLSVLKLQKDSLQKEMDDINGKVAAFNG